MNTKLALSVATLLLMSSCGTYTGDGAATGGYFGAILGSAIGGISGGPRGSDIGTLAGVVGGAVVGAAIGSAADKATQEGRNYQDREYNRQYDYGNGNDTYTDRQPKYDDRIEFENSHDEQTSGAVELEIRNIKLSDPDNDKKISGDEVCKVSFEIMNRSRHTIYDITPEVAEMTGNKHIYISPGVMVESIAPHKGVRYTASVGADRKIKDGYIKLRLAVKQGDNIIATTTTTIETAKKEKK